MEGFDDFKKANFLFTSIDVLSLEYLIGAVNDAARSTALKSRKAGNSLEPVVVDVLVRSIHAASVLRGASHRVVLVKDVELGRT